MHKQKNIDKLLVFHNILPQDLHKTRKNIKVLHVLKSYLNPIKNSTRNFIRFVIYRHLKVI